MSEIAESELQKIHECLGMSSEAAGGDKNLEAWRRNMLGKTYDMYFGGVVVKTFKAIDLADAIQTVRLAAGFKL